MRRKDSIIFFSPDYHNTFTIANILSNRGWRVGIWVPSDYPRQLLFSNQFVANSIKLQGNSSSKKSTVIQSVWYLGNFFKFRYHVYYSRLRKFTFFESKLGLTKLFGQDFSLALWLAKLIGVKIIYVPSGCHDEISKEDFQRITMPSICSNCGFFDKCNDNENNLNFKHVRRYSDLNVGLGYLSSREFVQENIKWKAIDKEVFHSRLEIPIHLKMKMSEKLRIYHGFVPSGRDSNGKSIKGSSHIVDAVEKLTTQGYQLELINVSTMNSNEVRFIQAQCDVIIDQLIYGWWGSTGVEGMALGKPVICYLRPEWKNRFMENYPQYRELPIIEASVDSIYVVLLSILKDRSILAKAAEKSVEFSKKHFDSNLNVNEFVEAIINL
jgi:hypothetical protein